MYPTASGVRVLVEALPTGFSVWATDVAACLVCAALEGCVFADGGAPPPPHHGCRCGLLPVSIEGLSSGQLLALGVATRRAVERADSLSGAGYEVAP